MRQIHILFSDVASSESYRRQNRALAELTACLAGVELDYRRHHPQGWAYTMNTEKLPRWYVVRKVLIDAVKARLPGAGRGVILWGMGGSGKTTLARALALEDEIRDRFRGGVLWACPEEKPVKEWLWDWLNLLRLEAGPQESEWLLGERVRQRLAERPESFLVVLDGVRRTDDVRHLLVEGEKDRLLVTTRDYGVGSALGMETETIQVGMMDRTESLALLRARVGEALWDPARADAFAGRVGDLPLALEIGAARVARRRARGRRAWSDLLSRMADGPGMLDVLQVPGATSRHESLRATLDAGYDELDKAARRLLEQLAMCCPNVCFSIQDTMSVAEEEQSVTEHENTLWNLFEQSWLYCCIGSDSEPVFHLHPLIKLYAME